jgi:hypothetical protein
MLEQFIRPFQSLPVAPTARLYSVAKAQPPQTSTLTWGAAGTLPVALLQIVAGGGGFKIDQKSMNTEEWRITEPVRIENPDNSSDFVMVDPIKQIGFTKPTSDQLTTSTVDKTTGATTTSTSGGGPVKSDYTLKNP